MMNKILQNLINTGKVASFIDDIIIEMEIEEGHDEIVKFTNSGLGFSLSYSHFHFHFVLFSYFSIFRT